MHKASTTQARSSALYTDASGSHGFLLSGGGVFTTLDDPLATLGTVAFGINNMGQIVGDFITTPAASHGFLLSGGTYFTLDDPLATRGTEHSASTTRARSSGIYGDATGDHGFLMVTAPNPPPPAGTTADMILRHDADGLYEIYDIGNNAFLAANFLGQVGTDFQFAGLGSFFGSDTTDMLLRSATTGGFEVYDISNNNITNAAALGTVGLDFQVAGFGDFNRDGATDMVLRNKNTGQFELYNISNNAITSASNLGTVGLNFQVAGFGDFNADGTTDMMLRSVTTGQFELYDIVNNQITSAFNIGTVGLDFQVAGFADFNQDGTTDMMLRNRNTGQFEVYDIRNNAITSASSPGTVGPDFQVAGFGPFHAARRVRHDPAQQEHRRVRGLRHRQQSDHDGQQLGHGRLGLVGRRFCCRSADRSAIRDSSNVSSCRRWRVSAAAAAQPIA